MKFEIGLSPALALVLFGCTTTTPKEPATSSCRVEIAVVDGKESRSDLGSRSCEEKRTVLIARRDRVPDSYFVAISIDGPTDHPIVTSDVLPISSTTTPPSETSDILMRHFIPPPGVVATATPTATQTRASAPPPPPSARAVVPGEWSEIAKGEWPDAERYRVLVRLNRS